MSALEAELERIREGLSIVLKLLEGHGARTAPERRPVERVPIAAAARRLGMGTSTLRRWIQAGHVAGIAVAGPGGRKVWSVELRALEALERGASGASERTSEQGQPRAATSAACFRPTVDRDVRRDSNRKKPSPNPPSSPQGRSR